MSNESVKATTVAALEATRRRWVWLRPVLEMPLVPVSQAAVLAAVLFALWVRPPVETARCGDGWRYVHITWQRPDHDEPVWAGTAGPLSWVTEGRVEARWGHARWSTASMNGLFTDAA